MAAKDITKIVKEAIPTVSLDAVLPFIYQLAARLDTKEIPVDTGWWSLHNQNCGKVESSYIHATSSLASLVFWYVGQMNYDDLWCFSRTSYFVYAFMFVYIGDHHFARQFWSRDRPELSPFYEPVVIFVARTLLHALVGTQMEVLQKPHADHTPIQTKYVIWRVICYMVLLRYADPAPFLQHLAKQSKGKKLLLEYFLKVKKYSDIHIYICACVCIFVFFLEVILSFLLFLTAAAQETPFQQTLDELLLRLSQKGSPALWPLISLRNGANVPKLLDQVTTAFWAFKRQESGRTSGRFWKSLIFFE